MTPFSIARAPEITEAFAITIEHALYLRAFSGRIVHADDTARGIELGCRRNSWHEGNLQAADLARCGPGNTHERHQVIPFTHHARKSKHLYRTRCLQCYGVLQPGICRLPDLIGNVHGHGFGLGRTKVRRSLRGSKGSRQERRKLNVHFTQAGRQDMVGSAQQVHVANGLMEPSAKLCGLHLPHVGING